MNNESQITAEDLVGVLAGTQTRISLDRLQQRLQDQVDHQSQYEDFSRASLLTVMKFRDLLETLPDLAPCVSATPGYNQSVLELEQAILQCQTTEERLQAVGHHGRRFHLHCDIIMHWTLTDAPD